MGGKIRTVEATEEDIWTAGQRIEKRQAQAFFYGLYLTGARTSELALFGPDYPLSAKAGEWYFTLPILKRRPVGGKPIVRTRPFFPAPPTSWEKMMLENLLDWVMKAREGGEIPAFDYQGRGKTEKHAARFDGPYSDLTRKGYSIRVTEAGVEKEEPVRPHWLRRFRITNLLLRSGGNVLAVRDFVGQKEYASTLRYYEGSELAFERLRRVAWPASPTAPPRSTPEGSPPREEPIPGP